MLLRAPAEIPVEIFACAELSDHVKMLKLSTIKMLPKTAYDARRQQNCCFLATKQQFFKKQNFKNFKKKFQKKVQKKIEKKFEKISNFFC